MNKVILLLGSNLGDRSLNLKHAAIQVEQELGKIMQSSAVYETAPWGNAHQQDFLNQAIILDSYLAPELLMKKIIAIEEKMGRVRKVKWEPRIVDIDILFFNNEVIELKDLTVPHPGIQLRKFVLMPLAEIIPDFIHPVLKKSVTALLADLKDPLEVTRLQTHLA